MKNIGFVGVAEATTVSGEVTLELAVGFETVNGKSLEPAGGAVAVGAGRSLVLGDQVIGTGGVEGYEGWEGVGVGVGVGVVVAVFGLPPHPAVNRDKKAKKKVAANN
jgi:hypothetical protein